MNPTDDGYTGNNGVARGAEARGDARLARALEEYRGLLEAGAAPERAAFLARYPDMAEELAECLSGLEFVHAVAPALSGGAAAGEPDAAVGPAAPLGDFRIVREVGRGGMGRVYEAEQVSLGRRVALKVLPFAATMDPRQLQRFHNEARAAAGLHHTNIVPVYAVGCERGVHYYAMQFIDDRTLADFIAQQSGAAPSQVPTTAEAEAAAASAPTAPPAARATSAAPRDAAYFRRIAEWGIQAAEALDCAHQLGIVHRDVKPANLMVDDTGRLWVTDFGLAQVQSDVRLTQTGDLVGTLRYMSPEQALAKRVVVDHRTDVYSLGATLYELLTLAPAVSGGDRQELLRQLAFEEPKLARRRNRAIPAELETIVHKALEKNPADRYATAQELADDLRRFLEDKAIRAKRPTLRQRAGKWARRHRPLVRAVTALGLALLLLGGVALWREQRQRAAAERMGEAGLARAELLQQKERWEEAGAVLAVAAGELEGRGLEALRERVERRKRDVDLLTRLEEARLQAAAGSKETGFDNAGADRLYAGAFEWYGLDVTALDPPGAAERVRASAIRTRVIAGLDHWAFVRDQLIRGSGAPLRAVADQADDDPWRRRLREAVVRGDRAALEGLAEEEGALSQPPTSLVLLADALWNAGNLAAVERLLRQAQVRHPADFWFNIELASVLYEKNPPDTAEAIRFYQAALALRPQSPIVYSNLGVALQDQGKLAEAVAAYRKAIELQPDFALAHSNLGSALQKQGKLAEAVAACQKAIALRPDATVAHYTLGFALHDQGKLPEAVAAWRKVIELQPDLAETHNDLGNALQEQGKLAEAVAAYQKAIALQSDYAGAHYNLGTALREQGKLAEAVAAFQKAIELKSDFADAHNNLGNALQDQGKLAEAVAAYRKAIELQPDYALAHSNLGNALRAQGKLAEAGAACRKAIELQPDSAEAHRNLGLVLQEQGHFADALAALKRAHELGSRQPNWRYPSAQWVREAERLVELDAKLPKVLNGEVEPADADERLALAKLCQLRCKSLYAAAVRFYTDAFTAQPALADDLNSQPRYNAACAAALAGCAQGEEAAKLDKPERSRLRRQALDWLHADLAAYRRLLEQEPEKARPVIVKTMQHWQQDTDFAGVRGPAALAQLPEAERQEWQKLWQEVEALRTEAVGSPKP